MDREIFHPLKKTLQQTSEHPPPLEKQDSKSKTAYRTLSFRVGHSWEALEDLVSSSDEFIEFVKEKSKSRLFEASDLAEAKAQLENLKSAVQTPINTPMNTDSSTTKTELDTPMRHSHSAPDYPPHRPLFRSDLLSSSKKTTLTNSIIDENDPLFADFVKLLKKNDVNVP